MNLPNQRRESNNIRLAILVLCLSFETKKPTSSTATKIEPKPAETKPEAVSQLAENEIQIGNLVWEKVEKSELITWANVISYLAQSIVKRSWFFSLVINQKRKNFNPSPML